MSFFDIHIEQCFLSDSPPTDRSMLEKEFFGHNLVKKDLVAKRKRRDFIPNEMKDEQYWERRRKNNLAAKRSREKRRLNDLVLGRNRSITYRCLTLSSLLVSEKKLIELTNENESLKAKLNLMLTRLNMKESEMEELFEEEQRLGHIALKILSPPSLVLNPRSMISDEDDREESINTTAMNLTRTETKMEPVEKESSSPAPSNESLLQILTNQILQKSSSNENNGLLKIASPVESKGSKKRSHDQIDDAAITLLSLNKPSSPLETQSALQSVINSVLRKPSVSMPKSNDHRQGENFHHDDQIKSFTEWNNLINYFSTSFHPSTSTPIKSEPRTDLMPLKLRMKMLNAKS